MATTSYSICGILYKMMIGKGMIGEIFRDKTDM